MASDPDRVKHLEMLQAIITRMASNSFLLKGWSVTLVAGIFALGAKDANATLVFLALVPVVTFWGLDGYFLWQERCFRALYRAAVATYLGDSNASPTIEVFSMDTSEAVKSCPNCSWRQSVFSITLEVFYGVLSAIILIAGIVFLVQHPKT
jgi:hypothetical protein